MSFFFDGGFPGGGFPGGGMGRGASGPVDNEELYKLLGLGTDATQDELKRNYRKLAVKHHPDKGGDPETFKAISAAYDVLSDPEKKALYDKYGKEGLEQGGGGHDADDVFSALFGGGRRRKGPQKTPSVKHTLNVKLEDAYKGKVSKLKISRDVICSSCKGAGGNEGFEKTCTSCSGRGAKVMLRQLGPGMMQQVQVACESCSGNGKSIDRRLMCKDCYGKKVTKDTKIIEVHVDKGVKNGHKINFAGQADEQPGMETGDLQFNVQISEHGVFKRRGADLLVELDISLSEALCGFAIPLKHLDDRTIIIKSEPGEIIKPGDIKCVMGEGMPIFSNPFQKGRLFVHFKITFPTRNELNLDSIAALDAILPPSNRKKLTAEEADVVEIVKLNEVDPDSFGQDPYSATEEAYDSDDGRGHGGGGGVQCANQ